MLANIYLSIYKSNIHFKDFAEELNMVADLLYTKFDEKPKTLSFGIWNLKPVDVNFDIVLATSVPCDSVFRKMLLLYYSSVFFKYY